MSKLYKHIIPWYAEGKNNNKVIRTSRGRQGRRPYGSLKLCTVCDMVWEQLASGSQKKYQILPKYGLRKITCRNCKRGASQ